jgi:hypothetical protein
MPKSVFNILAPAGGLYKRRSYQEHPPFTTPDCDNVWLDDAIEGRERVGSRPGFKDIGDAGGGRVRCLSSVAWLDGTTTEEATEEGTIKWRETLFAIIGTTAYYSLNNGNNWFAAGGGVSLSRGTVGGPLTAAVVHQKIYVGDTDHGEGDEAPIKVFDPSTNEFTAIVESIVDTDAPKDCTVAVAYRDRLLMTARYSPAGEDDTPHMWYMSRSGDPLDWDYTKTDVLSAVNGKTSSAAELGEPIVTAIPHGDDCVIFGCTNSIWTLRSDPNFGGSLDNLSQRVGIVGRNAWCRSPEGWLFFLTQDGVMTMPPGCGDTPRSISRERLPNDLLFVQGDAPFKGSTSRWVSMAYDTRFRGVHLWVSSYKSSEPSSHYWLDTKQILTQDSGNAASYWPMSMDSKFDVFSAYALDSAGSPTRSDVLLGGRNGDIRSFDTSEACESVSYVDVGPLSTTGRRGSYLDGRLDQINVVLANTSGKITYEIRSGESPEAAFDGEVIHSGTWTKQHQLTRPRLRNPYFVIRLSATGGADAWAFENITALTEERGKMRYQS